MNFTLEHLIENNPIFDNEQIVRDLRKLLELLCYQVNDAFQKCPFNPYLKCIKNIPYHDEFVIRDILVWFFAWAIPTEEAIDELVKHSPLIEIPAGRGYWASLVAKKGGDIVCFDSLEDNPNKNRQWYPVTEGSYEKLDSHPDRTLFICWPPYGSELADQLLSRYKNKNFIYVGEGEGGCNGDHNFHSKLEKEWKVKNIIEIPQWRGIYDGMFIYERK